MILECHEQQVTFHIWAWLQPGFPGQQFCLRDIQNQAGVSNPVQGVVCHSSHLAAQEGSRAHPEWLQIYQTSVKQLLLLARTQRAKWQCTLLHSVRKVAAKSTRNACLKDKYTVQQQDSLKQCYHNACHWQQEHAQCERHHTRRQQTRSN